jgi:hypothetical protein
VPVSRLLIGFTQMYQKPGFNACVVQGLIHGLRKQGT